MPKIKTQSSLDKNLKTLTGESSKPKTKTKPKQEEIKSVRSFDEKLFPYSTFPYRLEDKKENKTCWFSCYEHAEKHINRYRLSPKEYKLWHSPNLLKNL